MTVDIDGILTIWVAENGALGWSSPDTFHTQAEAQRLVEGWVREMQYLSARAEMWVAGERARPIVRELDIAPVELWLWWIQHVIQRAEKWLAALQVRRCVSTNDTAAADPTPF